MSHNQDMAKPTFVLALLLGCASFACAQVTVIDTGSTNVPGMNVKVDSTSQQAMVEPRGGSAQKITLAKELSNRLMEDLKTAGPLNELPPVHCMKSVSFGTSTFIEYNGVRSPDLSCRQTDPRAVALKKDASDILSSAKTQVPATRKYRAVIQ
jgi:hypothetical protein